MEVSLNFTLEERVRILAEILEKKLDSYTAEDNFESQKTDIEEKLESPGGPALLGIVGYVYISVSVT